MNILMCVISFNYGLEWIVGRGLADDTASKTEYSRLIKKNSTLDEARKFCDAHIRQSDLIKSCEGFLNDKEVDITVEDCANDVQITGVVLWMENYLQILKHSCIERALEIVPIDQDLPENIVSNLCLAKCQNNGTCHLGACICEHGFSGLQCEISPKTRPTVYPRYMFCDRQTSACDAVIIRGENFFQSDNITCILQYETYYGTDQTELAGSYINELQVSCPTPLLGLLKIQVSNGGEASAGIFYYLTYNSSCQQCVDDPKMGVSCNVTTGYCVIWNICVDDMDIDGEDSCNVCSSKDNKVGWSRKSDLSCHKKQLILWIICGALAVMLLFLSAIITLVFLIQRYRKSGSYNLSKPKKTFEVEMGVYSITQPF